MFRRLCSLFLTLLVLPALSQGEPRIVTFDFGFGGGLGLTAIQDRNDVGDMIISPYTGTGAGPGPSFLVSRASEDPIIPIACPDGTPTEARSLTRNRRAVGFCTSEAGLTRGFLWFPDGRPMQMIVKPGARHTEAFGVNDGLVVVGGFTDSSNRRHGFRWVGGVFTTLDAPFPGTLSTTLFAINKSWHSVGLAFADGVLQGFVLRGSVYTPIAVPGAERTIPLDLNNADHVVGIFNARAEEDGPPIFESFLFDGTTYFRIVLPRPEARFDDEPIRTDVTSLTNTGVISGRMLVPDHLAPDNFSFSRGFVLSGLPLEPIEASVALAARRSAVHDPAPAPGAQPWCGPHGPAKLQGTSLCPDH